MPSPPAHCSRSTVGSPSWFLHGVSGTDDIPPGDVSVYVVYPFLAGKVQTTLGPSPLMAIVGLELVLLMGTKQDFLCRMVGAQQA